MTTPLERLRYHVSGAIARGEAEAIVERPATVWAEYDSAAEWCAARGLNGEIGDPLPESLSVAACAEINADPEAFAERVRACAYARAMAKRDPEE